MPIPLTELQEIATSRGSPTKGGGVKEAGLAGRILVVDDLADVRRLITHVLQREGYILQEASNGKEALKRLREQPVDLVITDLRMPEMDGLELVEQIHSLSPETDIIVLTAYGTIQSAVQAMQRGAKDYLTKPFDIHTLREKVAHTFQARAQRAQAPRSPIASLVELGRILSSAMDLPDTLDAIMNLVQRTFTPTRIEIAVLDEHLPEERIVVSSGEPLDGWPWKYLSREEIVALAAQDTPWILWNAGMDETPCPHVATSITVPLVRGEEVTGTLAIARKAGEPFYTRDDAELLHVFATQIAIAMVHARARQHVMDSFRGLTEASLPAVRALVEALGTFDEYTRVHSEHVSRYARLLGKALGLENGRLEILAVGGLLHDLGKLGVGDTTLHKNGSLTPDEFDRVKLHPVMGAKILSGIPAFQEVIPLVKYHHEAYDGSGYPEGLAGEAIPLGARIIAIVDTFDALTTDRPYRAALSPQEALERLRSLAGSQLDPSLTQAWCDLVARGDWDDLTRRGR